MKAKVCFRNCAECQSARIDGSCSENYFYSREEAIAAIKENCNIAFINADVAGEVIEQYCEYVLGVLVSVFPETTIADGIKANDNVFNVFPVNCDSFTIKLPAVKIGELVYH